jgi:hypothetical protein
MKDKKKKYTKKYYTGGRVDMSKGGRVKAAVGGIQKAPMNRKTPPMSIEREEEIRPTVQPQVTPKQPITPPQQERFIENIDNAANNIDTTFRQAPTSTGKGSDQMFIGREGDIKPAMSVTDGNTAGNSSC